MILSFKSRSGSSHLSLRQKVLKGIKSLFQAAHKFRLFAQRAESAFGGIKAQKSSGKNPGFTTLWCVRSLLRCGLFYCPKGNAAYQGFRRQSPYARKELILGGLPRMGDAPPH
jgi:hypothetical protein